MNRPLKVLISAYACEPHKGSEPGVGWEYAIHLAKMCEVWVITRTNNRPVIEKELAQRSLDNLHFVYIDLPDRITFWKAGKRGMHLYYFLWQIVLYNKSKELHKTHCFDLLHHLTFGNIWLPTLLPFINIPFIWGPLGGGERIPWRFIKNFSLASKFKECVRSFIITTLKYNPFFLYSCKKAKAIIVKTEHTKNIIPNKHKNKVIQMTDVGIDNNQANEQLYNGASCRIICVGHLDYWRGFDLAIKSFANVKAQLNDAILVIVGDGAEKERLNKIVNDEKLQNSVLFLGAVCQDKYHTEMSKSFLYLNTCLKEGGVTSIIEAMKRGMPVISVDTGGVTNIVPMMKVPLQNPNQVVSSLSKIIIKIYQDSQLRLQVSSACKTSIEKHTWHEKANQIFKIYEKETLDCQQKI